MIIHNIYYTHSYGRQRTFKKTDKDRLDALKNLPPGITINQLIIGNQINNCYGEQQDVEQDDDYEDDQNKLDDEQNARKWISENPPIENELCESIP